MVLVPKHKIFTCPTETFYTLVIMKYINYQLLRPPCSNKTSGQNAIQIQSVCKIVQRTYHHKFSISYAKCYSSLFVVNKNFTSLVDMYRSKNQTLHPTSILLCKPAGNHLQDTAFMIPVLLSTAMFALTSY
jgi:hypothetical protein